MNPDSLLNRPKPDAVLFALDYRVLPIGLSPGDRQSSEASIQAAIRYLESLASGVKTNSGALCILSTFAPPPEALFGSLDCTLPGTLRYLVDNINRRLAEAAFTSGDIVLDVAGIAATVGLANWHDPQQ